MSAGLSLRIEEQRLHALAGEWAALDSALSLAAESEDGGEDLSPELAAQVEELFARTPDDIEPVVRLIQNEEAYAEQLRGLALPFRRVVEKLESKAKAADSRAQGLRGLLVRFVLRLGGKVRLPDVTVSLRKRYKVVVTPGGEETIPEEWWRVKRELRVADILAAWRKKDPIPLAVAVEEGDPYVVLT